MNDLVAIMTKQIQSIVKDNLACIYLYGSVSMGDFKLGWSDIDIVCLTKSMLSDSEAEGLVGLRQQLEKDDMDNKYYHCFEGIVSTVDEFVNNRFRKVVYWGTSGQRITNQYTFDECSLFQLIKYGRLVYGEDVRHKMVMPGYEDLKNHVRRHYQTIRKHALKTDESLYSCGWMLDIARGIYTLRYGDVISKTKAGEWAIKENICPEKEQMLMTLRLRNEPMKYKDRKEIKEWLSQLAPSIQKFADVLEIELNK